MIDKKNDNILVLGGTGLLGTHLSENLQQKGYNVFIHSNSNKNSHIADLTNLDEVESLINNVSPHTIINLVALTDIDRCEKEPNNSYLLNVRTIENVVHCISNQASKVNLIHISTDAVYDKDNSKEDEIYINNTYALSKYAAELAVAKSDAVILRTNFFGNTNGKTRTSYSDWIINQLKEEKELKVNDDIFFSPLNMQSLIYFIEHVMNNFVPGTYNLGSKGKINKAEFAKEVAKTQGLKPELIQAVSNISYEGRAKRSNSMNMCSSKFEKTFKTTLPNILDEIIKLKGSSL